MAQDWAWQWGVEDASFGLSCNHPASPITPELRERYMAGYNSHEARIAANRALVEAERARKARSQAAWQKVLSGEPTAKPKGPRKHPHGSDW